MATADCLTSLLAVFRHNPVLPVVVNNLGHTTEGEMRRLECVGERIVSLAVRSYAAAARFL